MRSISLLSGFFAAFVITSFAADAPKAFKVGEFSFSAPAKWESVEVTSPMRKAQLKVPGKDGKNADIIFFHFGEGNAGGTKANVDRWLGQFEEGRDKINAKIEESKAGNRTVTYVQADGTYKSGMPGGPTTPLPNTMLLGAILESAQGNVFVRMTGPVELVNSARDDFKKMIDTAAKEAK